MIGNPDAVLIHADGSRRHVFARALAFSPEIPDVLAVPIEHAHCRKALIQYHEQPIRTCQG